MFMGSKQLSKTSGKWVLEQLGIKIILSLRVWVTKDNFFFNLAASLISLARGGIIALFRLRGFTAFLRLST